MVKSLLIFLSSLCLSGIALGIESISVDRSVGGGLLVRVQEKNADPSQMRIMIDLDDNSGTGFGEYGIDWMIEGTTLYEYPENGVGWSWNALGQVSVLSENQELVYELNGVPDFDVMRMFVETFDKTWNVVARFPESGAISIDSDQLVEVDENGDGSLGGSIYQEGGSQIVIAVSGLELEPERLRVFINIDDRSETGLAPFGADYLVEGRTLYRHSGSGNGWDWSMVGPVAPVVRGNEVIYSLDGIEPSETIEFSIEKVDSDWEVLERYPAQGMKRLRREDLSNFSNYGPEQFAGPKNYQIDELKSWVPESLTVGFDDLFSGENWIPSEPIEPMLGTSGIENLVPQRWELEDAISGESWTLEPNWVLTSGDQVQWRGTVDGIDWRIIGIPIPDDGGWEVFVQIRSDDERLLRLKMGIEIPLVGWTWHDDVEYSREIESNHSKYAFTGNSPYGMEGEVSKYPFGVISKEGKYLALETDLNEPRIFQIAAFPEEDFFAVVYDFALTEKTKKFPGEAAFHVTMRSGESMAISPFREELAEYYRRNPALYERRPDEVGLWMPFTDLSKIADPEDFGFAYYEKGGAIGSDVDFTHDLGVLTLVYTEPWLYWLPMPQGMERSPQSALQLMERLAASGFGKANEFASGGLLGAARDVDGEIEMTFQEVPWNSGARMEVSTDPELPTRSDAPVNRAMAEFQFMKEQIAHPKVDGIYLDSLSAMFIMDYHSEALAVADYPATFTEEIMVPGLATPIAAYEFVSGLGRYMESQGKYLMGNFPVWNFPFFMPYIDIPGEETHWFHEGHYERMSDLELNYRRAMSGKKAWGFLLNGKYDHFDPQYAQRYFEDCLYWAFQPSLFSHDAANDPYWENAEWYERDRKWFRRYMPWIQRLAGVGWQPIGPARSSNEKVVLEHYFEEGSQRIFLTVRNTETSPAISDIAVPLSDPGERWVGMNPLDATLFWLVPNENGVASLPVHLAPEQVRLFVLFPARLIPEEIDFLEEWKVDGDESETLVAGLKSLQEQAEAGIRVGVELPHPIIRGKDQAFQLFIERAGAESVVIENIEVSDPRVEIAGSVSSEQVIEDDGIALPLLIPGDFEADSFLVEVDLSVDGNTVNIREPVDWDWTFPVSVEMSETTIQSIQSSALLPLQLRNWLKEEAEVLILWEGDFGSGELPVTLRAEEERKVYLSIPGNGNKVGQLGIEVRALDIPVFTGDAELRFLGKNASKVRDSSVIVETSGSFPGYSTGPLRDGVTHPSEEISFNQAAWASEDSVAAHWVRFQFSEPQEVKEVTIYWNQEGGVTYTSQNGMIRGRRADGTLVDLGSFENQEEVAQTTVRFDPVLLSSLEVYQPPRSGSTTRPNLLWITEIGVR